MTTAAGIGFWLSKATGLTDAIKIVAPQALPLPKAHDRRTRKMSWAAGVGGDTVDPDYHRVSRRAGPGHPGHVPTRKGFRARPAAVRVAPLRLPSVASARREGTVGRFGHAVTEVNHGAAVVVGVGSDKRSAVSRPPTPLPWRAGGLRGDLFPARVLPWRNGISAHGLSEPGQSLPGSFRWAQCPPRRENPIP